MPDNVSADPAPPMVTNEKPKPFRISTILGPGKGQDETDPLLLAQISGTEAVSATFAFELTLLQRTTNNDGSPRKKIEPVELINTVATFGISEAINDGEFFLWHDRHGVIDRFEEVGHNPFPNFRCYTARLVPALKLLERERTFRIFEDLDALTVIRTVFQAQGEIPSDYLVVNINKQLPKLPYIVQFGEDSLAFVHRLMAMHGLWYHFIHEIDRKTERMVLGEGRKQHPTDSAVLFTSAAPERRLVAGYRRVFAPGPRRIHLGEFNPLQPRSPFQGHADIDKGFDIATADIVHGPGRAQHRIFPAGFEGNDELRDAAKHHMEASETQIILATGQTKNRALRAGEGVIVILKQGETGQKCLVTTLSLHGLDANAGHAVDGFAGFMSLVWKGINPFSDGKLTDISAAIAQTEMGAFLHDAANTVGTVAGVVGTATSVFSPVTAIIALPDLLTKAADKLGPTAAAVTPITDASKKFLESAQIDFGNSFVGVSQVDDSQDSFLLPPPVATRQTARGPHVAVVIGPDGAFPTGGNDLFADALGRVRVRFPWEPPDESGDPLAKEIFDDPQRSAWLRVSEGWADHGWGMQFLPRIGQEVLVDFIDGNPERPVIVGRLYNAESGSGNSTLPFPSPRAQSTTFDTLTKLPNTASQQWPMSGIRTFSTPKPPDDKEKRFHVLRFDDSWKKEQIVLRSQGRLDETSFASTFQTSHADRHILVGGKNEKTGELGGSLITTVGGEDNLHVNKSRYTGIDVNQEQTIKGHLFVDVTGAVKIYSAAEINLSAPKIVMEASAKVSIKVGSSFVVVDPSGVFITGPMVQINSGGSALTVADSDMTDPLDAAMADPGDPLNWRELHKGSGGGGHHHHTAKASHGLNVTRNPDGSFQVTKGIKVTGTPDYVSTVIQDLTTINSTKDGHARMDRIDNSGKQVTIQNYDASHPKPASPNADTQPGNNTVADYANAGAPGTPAGFDAAGNPVVFGNGKGSDSTIHYDPADWPDPTSRTKAPGDTILNHEMGHADNQTHGKQDMSPNNTDTYGTQEEFNNLPNDNSYRNERNPDPSFQRKDYGDF